MAKETTPNPKKNKSRSAQKNSAESLADASWLADVLPSPQVQNRLTDEEKKRRIEASVRDILETLGLDLSNDSMIDTPRRIAKMYVDEIFSGLNPGNIPRITTIENSMQCDQMIVVRDISVLSTCEHHFQTIDGQATVAYIPTKRVIGLSKINRIVDFFARRPQVQDTSGSMPGPSSRTQRYSRSPRTVLPSSTTGLSAA